MRSTNVNLPGRTASEEGSNSKEQSEPNSMLPVHSTVPRLLLYLVPLFLGPLLFLLNNAAPIGALLHRRPGYVPLLLPRTEDSAQYLTWIEATQNSWALPDYHAPWQTEAALHVPFFWLEGKTSKLTQISPVYVYLVVEASCYILAMYALILLLKEFLWRREQAILAVAFMICSVPVRSYLLVPALLLKGEDWALLHCGYRDLTSEGFFQGISGAATETFGTATAILCLALLGSYFRGGKRGQLWIASIVLALSGFLHPYEFIPITGAAAITILLTNRAVRSAIVDLSVLCIPASVSVLFYFVSTRIYPWLKVAADLNRIHFGEAHWSSQDVLHLGWPLYLAFGAAFFGFRKASRQDQFLACYVILAVVGYRMPYLPWPQHLIDGLYYGAAILLVRKLDSFPRISRWWTNRQPWNSGIAVLIVAAALAPHVYFRYVFYRNGSAPTESYSKSDRADASLDEVAVIAWLRANAASEKLILAPQENAPWMATVPMHSFASHWLFSLTQYQQKTVSAAFFSGSLSDSASDVLLRSYGVSYVLVARDSPALRYLRKAKLRWSGEQLALYEFPGQEMKPVPQLSKDTPSSYVWNWQ